MTASVLTTEPLSRTDKLDLEDHEPDYAGADRAVALAPGELGEPTAFLVMLTTTMTTFGALSAWLAARGKDVELDLELEGPGVKGKVKFKARSGESAQELAQRAREAGAEVTE